MVYVICFIAGATAAVSALTIWYYAYVAVLRKERASLRNQEERLKADSLKLSQQANAVEDTRFQLNEAIAAFEAR